MKKIIMFFLLFFPFASLAEEVSTYDRVIAKNEVVCGVIPWAPYAELDPNTKEWKGPVIEIFRKVLSTLDLKVTFKEIVLGTQLQDLNTGRVDTICGDGPWTMSAGKFIEFSDPMYAVIVFPFVRSDETRFKTRADLNRPDVHFTGIDGDISADLVHRLFPKAKYSSMPGITDVSQLYLNVATRKADVVIGDTGAYLGFSKNNPGVVKPLYLSSGHLGIYKAAFSLKKGDIKMLGLMNQAVDNALTFGLLDEVLDKFDPDSKQFLRVRSRYENGK